MADDSESSDRFSASRNSWELVSLKKIDHVLEKASSSASGSDELSSLEDHTLFNVDYFAVPSADPSCDAVQKPKEDEKNESLRMENVESPPTTSELDWIEPSAPLLRSCVIGTSEDDDSSSRSCSADSREGSTEHLLREKDPTSGFDRDPYMCEYTAVLCDVPMDAIGESSVEPPGVKNDASSEGHEDEVPWRRCWLSEAGRASTVCSIALAAAIIGLVLVGSGWHRIRLQYQKFRCRFFPKGKGIIQVMHHLIHIKGSSSKLRRVPVVKTERCCSGILNDQSE